MKRYIDGFVFCIKKDKLRQYQKLAAWAGKVWMKHGALEYVESIGNDLKGHPGCLSFPALVKPRANEIIGFSYIVYKSKHHRNRVNANVMKDPLMNQPMDEKSMPFDMKRMAYAGFSSIVALERKK